MGSGAARFIKALLKGIGLGISYYILFYIVILGILVYLVIPGLLATIGQQYGLTDTDIRDLVVKSLNYSLINYNVLVFFIIMYVAGSLLREFIPYGAALEGALSIFILYYILSTIGFGVFEAEIPGYNILLELDFSPMMHMIFYVLVMITAASTLLRVRSEYKKRRSP